jgi:hypothetical protein
MNADSFLERLMLQRGEQSATALAQVRGLKLKDAHRGVLACGESKAEVHLEPGDSIRVRLAVDEPPSPLAALAATHDLPGNVRYAAVRQGMALMADTALDGHAHLERTFLEIVSGLQQAGGKTGKKRRDTEPVDPDSARQAIAELKWGDEAAVQRPDGWELRPRFQGEALPVQAALDAGRLRLWRVVVPHLPQAPAADAVAGQALRFNAQVRLARLALYEGQFVAETCLHLGLTTPCWLATAAQAVAAAAQHTQPTLRLLAEDTLVAAQYAAMFGE